MRPDDLERALASRAGHEPTEGLRDRLLAAVAAERRALPPPPSALWRVAWRVAAAVALAVNLAMCAANADRYQSPGAPESRWNGRADEPAPAGPDNRFDAVAASALAQARSGADATAVARRFFERQED